MGFWSDPTDCLTEEEERAIDRAYAEQWVDDLMFSMDEAFDALCDDPDLEAMVTAPATTVAPSTSLLDAMKRNAE